MKAHHHSNPCASALLLVALGLPAAAMAAGERPAGGDAATGNRIKVTGNTARQVDVRCRPDGTALSVNVNSVNVDSAALRGKTVIVTGRNAQDVRVQDCPPTPAGRPPDGVNVDSVNIR